MRWRRGPVVQGGRWCWALLAKWVALTGTRLSGIDFSFAAWVYCRSTQCEFPVDCGMFSEAKRIELPQRVEGFDRNRL